ncbi:succinate dehydrogenase/fumarate reductase iron-sulfur subunit [Thermocrinis minervae]|uniref:NADH-dependent fumarate reductase subunit B n=1 Tax=Thermocrinis minervae TaxID=381751 RepID=A0A1M6SAM2_9AQUI|nr:succinate dehydrogenase/fumarate reductase iron-sulfur subunit [Thermocrinis minervae]SHK41802.1 NADH-dependent fumarate reductase subunit B [Thermocrinis minervae]
MFLKLKVRRQLGQDVWYQTFEVPYQEGMTFLSAFWWIKENIDNSFTFRHFCRAGICGTCTVQINGFPKLACKEQVLPYVLLGEPVVVEPLKNFEVIRDLVVDNEKVIRKMKELKLWISSDSSDVRIEAQISQKIESAADCILCCACQSYCPQVLESVYAGPLFFAKIYRFIEDPREKEKELRLNQAVQMGHLYHCLSCNKCNNVCPKEVEPATLIRRLMLYAVDNTPASP